MDFTKGHIRKSIFSFSIPLVLGNIFQQLYTLVNSTFVGKYLGVNALAAVGSCYPIVFFITSMLLGIGAGGSVVVSHYYGAKQHNSILSVISTFYIFFISVGIIICLFSIIFADNIFSILNMENNVKYLAVKYFQIYMAGMFFSVLFHSAISILRGIGDSTTQLYFLIPANILNIILSYIFLGIMRWGLETSAVASLISQFIASATLFIYLHNKKGYIRFSYKNAILQKIHLKQIISIGIPMGIQQSIVSLTQIMILWLVVKFGTNATAAYSAAMRIESIALLFVLNISQSLTTFTGTNIGANSLKRAKQGFYASLQVMGIISVVTMLVFCFFNTSLMRLFTDNQEVIRIGNEYLLVSGVFWFIFCWQMMYTAFFRGVGKATITMVISLFSLWIVRYPVSYLLSLNFHTMGIWLGAPIAWATGVIIYIILFKTNKWSKKNIIRASSLLLFISSCSIMFNSKAEQNHNINILSEIYPNNGNDTLSVTKSFTKQLNDIKFYYDSYPQNYFISPLSIPLTLAGTFAELRGSHFHSGLDFRTNGETGYVVIAPADGYVSRIKVQAYGGGKNLYIKHPNGYTSVYMHLESYEGEIGKFVKDYQYKNKCYVFDYTFPKPEIYIKQGQIIALSGQSGMVGGPHLHFEIRNSQTEQPINPLLFGLQIKDSLKPYIQKLALTPMNHSSVEGQQTSKIIDLIRDTTFHQGDTIKCYGDIFFSILAYDPSLGSSNRNGVWKTELFIDNSVIFSHHMETFSFSEYGLVDAIINYPLYVATNERMLCSKQMDNGTLPYNTYKNKGILEVQTDSIYKVVWKLTDLCNNTLFYTYYVKGVFDSTLSKRKNNKKSLYHFSYASENKFRAEDGSIFIFPKNCLYENIDFIHSKSKGRYSDIHRLHTVLEPVKNKFNIKIKPYTIVNRLKNKYLIVKINSKGEKSSIGGNFKNGFIETTTSTFGHFTVWVDTIAPKIKALNFKSNKSLKDKQTTLKVSISDNLSGINTYDGYMNNEWILMEFDGKLSTLTYTIDEKLKKGKNELKIIVTDKKNNRKTANFHIIL